MSSPTAAHLPPFDAVVSRYGELVLRVCRALLGRHDAEDAAAEAWLAALEAYPRLRPDSNVKAWLVTVAHRKALDALRRASTRAVAVGSVPEQRGDGDQDLPDDEVWRALGALPDKQRQAVAYHHIADLAYRQVAEIMGTTEVAARRNAADGIRALRRAVGDTRDEHRGGPDA